MPVGRFRKDPRELDEVESRVAAAQYPESSLMFGMGVGLILPMAAGELLPALPSLAVTLATGFGPIVGGVVGYLLGHAYKKRKLRKLRRRSDGSGGVSPSPTED